MRVGEPHSIKKTERKDRTESTRTVMEVYVWDRGRGSGSISDSSEETVTQWLLLSPLITVSLYDPQNTLKIGSVFGKLYLKSEGTNILWLRVFQIHWTTSSVSITVSILNLILDSLRSQPDSSSSEWSGSGFLEVRGVCWRFRSLVRDVNYDSTASEWTKV